MTGTVCLACLTDLFRDSPYQVELEKDLSLKQQFLDIVIVRKGEGKLTTALPDGFDDLGNHALITYKSLREPLDDWTLKELTGHYANYRKQTSGDCLLPEAIFRLYAVATRFPRKLATQVAMQQIQSGVYIVQRGTDQIRIIVLNKIPKTPHNALWCVFSNDPALMKWGDANYQNRSKDMSTIINQVFERCREEGIAVSYTMEEFRRDYTREHLHLLSPDEVLSNYKPDQVLSHYKPGSNHYKPDKF